MQELNNDGNNIFQISIDFDCDECNHLFIQLNGNNLPLIKLTPYINENDSVSFIVIKAESDPVLLEKVSDIKNYIQKFKLY